MEPNLSELGPEVCLLALMLVVVAQVNLCPGDRTRAVRDHPMAINNTGNCRDLVNSKVFDSKDGIAAWVDKGILKTISGRFFGCDFCPQRDSDSLLMVERLRSSKDGQISKWKASPLGRERLNKFYRMMGETGQGEFTGNPLHKLTQWCRNEFPSMDFNELKTWIEKWSRDVPVESLWLGQGLGEPSDTVKDFISMQEQQNDAEIGRRMLQRYIIINFATLSGVFFALK